MQIPFAVRRMLQQLPEPGEIPAGGRDVAGSLDDEPPQRPVPLDHPAVRGGPGDEDVVALAHRERAEDRLQRARSRLQVDTLVADRVAVQGAGQARGHVRQPDVVVPQHDPAAGDGVGGLPVVVREQVVQLEVAGDEWMVRGQPHAGQLPRSGVDQRRGQVPVVEQRGVRGEALLADELLVVQAAVGAAELGVPLGRHLTDAAVVRHGVLLGAGRASSLSRWTPDVRGTRGPVGSRRHPRRPPRRPAWWTGGGRPRSRTPPACWSPAGRVPARGSIPGAPRRPASGPVR